MAFFLGKPKTKLDMSFEGLLCIITMMQLSAEGAEKKIPKSGYKRTVINLLINIST